MHIPHLLKSLDCKQWGKDIQTLPVKVIRPRTKLPCSSDGGVDMSEWVMELLDQVLILGTRCPEAVF